MNLHVLHTNDVHSDLALFARLTASLSALRDALSIRGEHVLVFDIGDHLDRIHPLSDATCGRVNAAVLRALQYDGMVLGNNETLTLEKDHLHDYLRTAQTPVFCSNMTFPDDIEAFADGRMYDLNGLKLGVFGVTVFYPAIMEALGVNAFDAHEAAWRVSASLRNRGADVVIMLSHLGLAVDQSLADEGLPVDLIVGAHTHHFLQASVKRGNTWIVQAGKQGIAYGHTVICVEDKRVANITSKLVYTDRRTQQDPRVIRVTASFEDEARRTLNRVVGYLHEPLRHAQFGESDVANLLCDQMRREFAADVAIVNGGVITASLREGAIARGDLLAICGTPMRAVLLEIDVATLCAFIEAGLALETISKRGFGFGFRGHYIGRIHVSGVEVFAASDPSIEGGRVRVLHLKKDGRVLRGNETVTAAICEYLALSPVYTNLHPARYVYAPPMMRELLERAFAQEGAIEVARVSRVFVDCASEKENV